VTCTETFATTSGVLGNKHNKVRRSEIYFLTSDVLQNKKKFVKCTIFFCVKVKNKK
jgi:hypothetical protein